jgi:outer membrane protein TolC
MKKVLMAIMCFTVANLAFSIELDMTGAVNMAYENNYEIKNAKKDLENYGLQVKEAYKSGLPTLSYSGTYSMLENKIDNANPDSDKSVSQTISLTQPIFMGGQVITGITSSKKAKEMAEYTYTQKKKDVKLEVEKQYIGILKLQKQKEIIETSLKKLKEDFIKVGVLYDLSIVSKSSVLDLDYSITQIETSLIEVENGIEISKLQLKNMIGIIILTLVDFIQVFPLELEILIGGLLLEIFLIQDLFMQELLIILVLRLALVDTGLKLTILMRLFIMYHMK